LSVWSLLYSKFSAFLGESTFPVIKEDGYGIPILVRKIKDGKRKQACKLRLLCCKNTSTIECLLKSFLLCLKDIMLEGLVKGHFMEVVKCVDRIHNGGMKRKMLVQEEDVTVGNVWRGKTTLTLETSRSSI
jgi:hypothetical protein